MQKRLVPLVLLFVGTLAWSAPVPVTVNVGHGMTRGGEPYFVKGAGGETHLDWLQQRGANSLRTWGTDTLAKTLGEAEKLGLTVSAGIWLESECAWFSYKNPEHCAKQAERVKKQVIEYRDHPSLLAWGIGNESEGDGGNAAFWQQLDKLSVMVHEIDPAHPTFTAVAGLNPAKAAGMNQHAPHLDYVGINTYGGLFGLRKHLEAMGWKRPWLVTEWGPQGFWERPRSSGGAPLEQTSTEKAAMMDRGYNEVIKAEGGCLGSYAFVWGSKFEATATWFGLITHEGETTESVDVLEKHWSGKEPSNHAPQVKALEGAPKAALSPGDTFDVRIEASDADGDTLSWHWVVLPEKPLNGPNGQHQVPPPVDGAVASASGDKATIAAPKAKGNYRVYARVTDGHGHAATANAPFTVQ